MKTAALQDEHSAEHNSSRQWYNSGFKEKIISHSLKNNPAQMDGLANNLS